MIPNYIPSWNLDYFQKLFDSTRLHEAITYCRWCLVKDSSLPIAVKNEIFRSLAQAHAAFGATPEEEKALNQIEPQNRKEEADKLFRLACAYSHYWRHAKLSYAEDAYLSLAAEYEDVFKDNVHWNLVDFYLENKRFREAETYLKQFIGNASASQNKANSYDHIIAVAKALFRLGEVYQESGRIHRERYATHRVKPSDLAEPMEAKALRAFNRTIEYCHSHIAKLADDSSEEFRSKLQTIMEHARKTTRECQEVLRGRRVEIKFLRPEVKESPGHQAKSRRGKGKTASLSGTVWDPTSDSPLVKAGVTLKPSWQEEPFMTKSDTQGKYSFSKLPPGNYDYIAVTQPNLNSASYPTVFPQQKFKIAPGESKKMVLEFKTISDSHFVPESEEAQNQKILSQLPLKYESEDGITRSNYIDFMLDEQANIQRYIQPVTYTLSFKPGEAHPDSLRLIEVNSKRGKQSRKPFQLVNSEFYKDGSLKSAQLITLVALQAKERIILRLFYGPPKADYKPQKFPSNLGVETITAVPPFSTTKRKEQAWVVTTGTLTAWIPQKDDLPCVPPLRALKGPDGKWRGQGRLVLPSKAEVEKVEHKLVESGPITVKFSVRYRLQNGLSYTCYMTFYANQPYVVFSESSDGIDGGAFQFSVYPGLKPDRTAQANLPGAYSYRAENINYNEDLVIAEILHTYMWANPREPLAHAFYSTTGAKDAIGCFPIRSGYWNDARFEEAANTPLATEPERDWSELRWWGSPISAITARIKRHGDAYYHSPIHEGTRHWALFILDKSDLDGDWPLFGKIKTDIGEQPLDYWKEIPLSWRSQHLPPAYNFSTIEPTPPYGKGQIPHKAVTRKQIATALTKLARQKRPRLVGELSRLSKLRENATDPKTAWIFDEVMGRAPEYAFVLKGGPASAWQTKKYLFAAMRKFVQQAFRGKENARIGPPRCRRIVSWCYAYDLLEPSGVFTSAQRDELKRLFILIAFILYSPTYMAWRTTAGHPNFDADRYAALAMCALTVPAHPGSAFLIDHAIFCFENAMRQYVIPKSGKWAENIGCYYFASLNPITTMLHHLQQTGIVDLYKNSKFRSLLWWPLKVLTPPHPVDKFTEKYGIEAARKRETRPTDMAKPPGSPLSWGRRIPGVGSHGDTGRHPSVTLMIAAKGVSNVDSDLAGQLAAAWRAGGLWTLGESTYPSHLAADILEPADVDSDCGDRLKPQTSRRLEAYGAVCRANWGDPEEGYILFKCGPGGYRYHRDDGSFIWYEKGVPLVLDGGDDHRASAHSSITFGHDDDEEYLGRGQMLTAEFEKDYNLLEGQFPASGESAGSRTGSNPVKESSYDSQAKFRLFQSYLPPALKRTLLYAKGKYLLILDRSFHPRPSLWHLHVLADNITTFMQSSEPAGKTQVNSDLTRIPGFTFTGRFGIDLDLFLLDKAMGSEAQQFSFEVETKFFRDEAHPDWDGVPQIHFTLRRPGYAPSLSLLIPRKSGEKRPTIKRISRNHFNIEGTDFVDQIGVNWAFGSREPVKGFRNGSAIPQQPPALKFL